MDSNKSETKTVIELKENNFYFDIRFKVLLPETLQNKLEAEQTAGSKLTKADAGKFLKEILDVWNDVFMPEFIVKKKKLPKFKAGAELGYKESETKKKLKKVKRFINADA